MCSTKQSKKGPDLGRVAWGLVGIETKWRPIQPAAVCVEHSRQTSGFYVDPWFGLVFSTTVIAMTQRGKVQMECTGKDCDRRAQLPSRETWSQTMVSSGNPSHAKQEDLLKHVHQKRKKMKKKKKHKGRSTLLSASMTFLLHPIWASLRQLLQQTFAASLVTADGCRQDIPEASGTGKLHVKRA